tara:strand:- start:26559 stop:26765 length:207 start_codon:yes stop_codon:yes gene_type:complete
MLYVKMYGFIYQLQFYFLFIIYQMQYLRHNSSMNVSKMWFGTDQPQPTFFDATPAPDVYPMQGSISAL